MKAPQAMTPQEYWHACRNLSLLLLAIWAGSSFAVLYYAAELQDKYFFSWPLSHYLLAQGLLVFYLALVAIYAWQMRRLNRRYRRAL